MSEGNVIYPGTFDPITNGHISVISRAMKIFDRLTVAILNNPNKKPLFSLQERTAMIQDAVKVLSNVEVDAFEGLLVDYAVQKNSSVIIRGLRALSDFEYEFQMALTNRTFAPDIETVFVMSSEKYSFLSSRLIKETVRLGGDVSAFVPIGVQERLAVKLLGDK